MVMCPKMAAYEIDENIIMQLKIHKILFKKISKFFSHSKNFLVHCGARNVAEPDCGHA